MRPGEEDEGRQVEPRREADGFSALLAQLAAAEPEPAGGGGWMRGVHAGDVVGRFELLRELGRGGFGVVYEARDRELGRLVAFKAIRPGNRARSAQRVEWLRREAEATAQLSHENIVALHDAGRAESGPFLVFELLEGETLEERLRRGALPPAEAIRVAEAVTRALSYAHAAGVLHRDLKPSNVFLTDRGQVKVLDFGLAHVFGWSAPRSGGTAPFMAPEQWRGDPEDGRTDLFAAGVLLYEMVTGRLPYDVHDGRSSVLEAQAPAPVMDGVPAPLRPLLVSALAPRPEERPRSAQVLLERLLEADRALSSPRRRGGRWALLLGAGGALVIAAVIASAWLLARSATRRAPGGSEAVATAPGAASRGATDSVDAYRHYFAAVKAMDAIRYDDAMAELGRALELDPEFALALYLRAYLGEFTGDPVAVRRASAEAAARYADRLPEKEQLLVRAWVAHMRGDDAEARRIHSTAVDRYPDDAEVLYFAGDLLFHADELEPAIPLFQRALEARPGWGAPLGHLLDALDALDRRADLLPVVRRAVAESPNAETYVALGWTLIPEQPDEGIRALRSAVTAGGGPEAIQQLSDGLLRAGRIQEAEAEARNLLAPEMPPTWQLEGHHQLLKVRAFEGRHREVLRLLDRIPPALRAANPSHQHETATAVLAWAGGDRGRLWLEARSWGSSIAAYPLAHAGDLGHAAEVARGLSPGARRELYEGLASWRRGDLPEAARRLSAAARKPGQVGRKMAWYFLGAVLGELGRDREALDALRRFGETTTVEPAHAFALPKALLVSARSLERLGRREEALRDVDRLLGYWRRADPELPELAQARALRARLLAAGARARR